MLYCQEHAERVKTHVLMLGLCHSIAFHYVGDHLIATGVTKANIATEIIGYTTTWALGTGTQTFNLILVSSLNCGGKLWTVSSPFWTSSIKCDCRRRELG